MFNLLMQSAPWGNGRGTLSVGRMFEYTDEGIKTQFRKNGAPLINELIQLPCLFMQEGTESQLARVGKITDARVSGYDVVLEYLYFEDIPPILNSQIYRSKLEFDMPSDFEFSRGH